MDDLPCNCLTPASLRAISQENFTQGAAMQEHSADDILTRIMNFSQGITQIKDVDILLEKILSESRKITNADAGSIYVNEDATLLFKHAQNDTLQHALPQDKSLIFSSFTLPVDSKSIAGYVAETSQTVNIADAYKISKSYPFSFDDSFDRLSGYTTHSILAFPLKTPQGQILGVLQLINAKNGSGQSIPFSRDDEPFILHFANTAAIALERAKMTKEIILRMLRMAEMRDPNETGAHVNRVGAYAAEIYASWAAKQQVPADEIDKTKDVLRLASMLHDVGKVAISDTILKKPAKLEADEFENMKQHTLLGARLFADARSEFDSAAYHIALDHHERWDGKGYPGVAAETGRQDAPDACGPGARTPKRGPEIHPFGRIVAVADVYDALSSRRCYKDAWDENAVLDTIRQEAGHQFDPDVVEAFFQVLDVLKNIREQYPDATGGSASTADPGHS